MTSLRGLAEQLRISRPQPGCVPCLLQTTQKMESIFHHYPLFTPDHREAFVVRVY